MSHLRLTNPANGGFSLIEIMIGMVIGALGVALMLQLFAASEGQKRTVTGGGDAQTDVSIALNILRSDIGMGGYGLVYTMMGCNLQLRAGVTLAAMGPVVINHASIPAGDPNTDTLLVIYGSSNYLTDGQEIVSPSTAPTYTVRSAVAFAQGDWVIAVNSAGPCTPATPSIPNPMVLDTITAAPTVAPVPPALAGSYNLTVAAHAGTAVLGGTLFNLGQAPIVRAYAVRNGALTMCDYIANECSQNDPALWLPMIGNIVSLRAQYGRDTATPVPTPIGQTTYRVDTYDQATPTTACGWLRTPVVRLALVARSDQYEKDTVTAAAPIWDGSAGNAIDLSTNTHWSNYRYKLLQTVAPIRNMAWMGVQTGC